MMDDDQRDASAEAPPLEYYALAPSYGRLTGVSVACHAIEDGYLLMHVGVGCKNKVTHLLNHDWEKPCNLRQGWTEVGDRDLITGASRRVGPYIRSWKRRMDSGFVCVVSVTFLELAGEDVADEVQLAADDSDVPVVLIPALGFDGDEFDGYAEVSRAVLESLPWSKEAADSKQAKQVAIAGYWFDRYEGDHSGNLTQLAALLKGLGLELGPVLFSGTKYAALNELPRAGHVVVFPYLGPQKKKLARTWRRGGVQPIHTDLPMGIRGTSRWLRELAAATGLDPLRTEAYARLRSERTMAPLAKMRGRWSGHTVAVLAEAPLAAGLCSALLDLGVRPVMVATRGRSLGGRDEVLAVLRRDGHTLPSETEFLEAPSLSRLREWLHAAISRGAIKGVLGSATELNLLRDLDAPFFTLEVGFPCSEYHALTQQPFLGYGGVAALAQRILTAAPY